MILAAMVIIVARGAVFGRTHDGIIGISPPPLQLSQPAAIIPAMGDGEEDEVEKGGIASVLTFWAKSNKLNERRGPDERIEGR
jgi:hypothetical protein